MRTSFSLRTLVVFLCWCWGGHVTAAHASHLMGAELTYEYAGTPAAPYQYRVTAWLFQDARPLTVSTSDVDLICTRNGCDPTLPGSFTTTLRQVRTVAPVPPLCSGPGAGLEYRMTVLQGLVQLPPGRWTLSFDGSNRRLGVVNFPESNEQSLFMSAVLDNSTGLVNSSPQFTTHQLFHLIGSPDQRFSLNAFDSEGDSLVYQLVQPLERPATTASCASPAPGATVAPHFRLAAATGELTLQANSAPQGVFVLAVRVDEYRRISGAWQQIGSITRDMLYMASTGTNQPPAFTRVAFSGSPSGQLLGQTIGVGPGQTVALTLTATDPDTGQGVQLVSDVATLVPGTSFQDQGNGQALLTWQVPAAFAPGRYAFSASAYDDACPARGVAALTISFLVSRPVLATRARQPLAQLPYPVPFAEEVKFQFAEQGRQPVMIVDELGRTVALLTTAPDGSVSWRPAATLPAGLYLARNLGGTQVARLPYTGR